MATRYYFITKSRNKGRKAIEHLYKTGKPKQIRNADHIMLTNHVFKDSVKYIIWLYVSILNING